MTKSKPVTEWIEKFGYDVHDDIRCTHCSCRDGCCLCGEVQNYTREFISRYPKLLKRLANE